MTSPAVVTLVADTTPPQVTVESVATAAVVVSAALQGARGPVGPPGDALHVVASAAISGHRVITIEGEYAEHTSASARLVAGISTHAAVAGELVTVQRSGVIEWPAGGLTPGLPLYLGANGQLTHDAPTQGWLRQIAVARAVDRIIIDIGSVYDLGD